MKGHKVKFKTFQKKDWSQKTTFWVDQGVLGRFNGRSQKGHEIGVARTRKAFSNSSKQNFCLG